MNRRPHLIIGIIGGIASRSLTEGILVALSTSQRPSMSLLVLDNPQLPPIETLATAFDKLAIEAHSAKESIEKLAAELPCKQTAFERANPTQPFSAKFRKKEKRKR